MTGHRRGKGWVFVVDLGCEVPVIKAEKTRPEQAVWVIPRVINPKRKEK